VTRRRIADAARRLFASRGYGATTLQAVADEAGVAVQTVYAVYRSKAGILRSLREGLASHPEAAELYVAALSETDPGRKIDLFARSIRNRWDYGHDIVAVHEQAGRTDRSVLKEVEKVLAIRRNGITRLAQSFGKRVDPARATAILDALTVPEIYRELVEISSWTPDDYETWLARTLRQQLLATRL
jgi:AcrR family transcriptional regulator